jgi:hypothetical protein
MSQERLSGLTILSIEKNMLEKIDYKSLINNFASKRARKMKFYPNLIAWQKDTLDYSLHSPKTSLEPFHIRVCMYIIYATLYSSGGEANCTNYRMGRMANFINMDWKPKPDPVDHLKEITKYMGSLS